MKLNTTRRGPYCDNCGSTEIETNGTDANPFYCRECGGSTINGGESKAAGADENRDAAGKPKAVARVIIAEYEGDEPGEFFKAIDGAIAKAFNR